MLELLGQGLLAILAGGATGIIGIIIQRVFDHWKNKQELDVLKAKQVHEEAMRGLDVQLMKEEWAQRVKVAEVEGETARGVADAQAFAASFSLEPKRYAEGVKPGRIGGFLLILADVIRGIVRPGLTIYLAWIATALYLDSQRTLTALRLRTGTLALDEVQIAQVVDLHRQIVFTLLYLFTTCVLWWFGTRNKAPQPKLG